MCAYRGHPNPARYYSPMHDDAPTNKCKSARDPSEGSQLDGWCSVAAAESADGAVWRTARALLRLPCAGVRDAA
jgi:hypothetical protein